MKNSDPLKSILAIAIEDRIDLWYGPVGDPFQPTVRLSSKPIPEGGNYVQGVYGLLVEIFRDLRLALKKTPAREIFDSVRSTVVSVPGVVEDQKTLLQIPVWNSQEKRMIDFQYEGRSHQSVRFPTVLAGIAKKLIESESSAWPPEAKQRFESTVWAVNDCSACAAFENDRSAKSDPDFSYVKVHGGTNVAIVESTSSRQFHAIRTSHGEVGHVFPVIHPMDAEVPGVCVHHGWCLEGLAAAHSFLQRAKLGGNDTFVRWGKKVEELETKHRGQHLDNALIDYVLGVGEDPPEAGDEVGVEILAHYVSQMVWQIALAGMSSQIVLGGRMARPRVITAVRRNVLQWSNGYPRRSRLGAKIGEYIRLSRAKESEQDYVEVHGAFAIAAAREHLEGYSDAQSQWARGGLQPLLRGKVRVPKD